MVRLEHIGIAVNDRIAVENLYKTLLEVVPYKTESVLTESVRTVFISADTTKLELLQATALDSPIAKYLDKKGEGLHHLAFEVADIQQTMTRLREAGFQPLQEAPKQGADGKLIFFLHPKQTHGVLVEFCQSIAPVLEPTRYAELTVYVRGARENTPLMIFPPEAQNLVSAAGSWILELEKDFYIHGLEWVEPTSAEKQIEGMMMAFWAEGLPKTVVLGMEDGCGVALLAAAQHASSVSGLVLYNLNLDKVSLRTLAQIKQPVLLLADDQFEGTEHLFSLRAVLPQAQIAILPKSLAEKPALPTQIIRASFA